ncbi:MAG: hypothetical protein OEZ06_06695 [Myxococcales bacterium]|nr:hypothetical protein [Myxococcales bacterium]
MPNAKAPTHVSIMDTTLRDGEQTPHLAFTPSEKLHIARSLILDVGVDRIEVASTGVSSGEREATGRVLAWAREAGCAERIEVLGFCDGQRSARWMAELGGGAMNLLLKGSESHCRRQLGLEPEQHFNALERTLQAARDLGVPIAGAYLEDWSRGIAESPDYVMAATARLRALHVPRIYLADTLGCLSPAHVASHVKRMVDAFPGQHFEFHGHNDYGLATANALAAVAAGARGVHTSVNGLGERAGNARLAEVAVALRDHAGVSCNVNEAAVTGIASLVETFSGKPIAHNAPLTGRDVFTQTAGVHADGDRKGQLYASRLSPDRFGRRRDYALGKLSGHASLDQNLEQLGIRLEKEQRSRLLARVVELGDQKQTIHPSDLPLLVHDLFGDPRFEAQRYPRITDYRVTIARASAARGELTLRFGERTITTRAEGTGGYDALVAALRTAMEEFDLQLPALTDFRVRIPPSGGPSALVEASIEWSHCDERFTTVGVDPDQLGAAIIATQKMLARVCTPGVI